MITIRFGIPSVSPGAMLREEARLGSKLGQEAEELTRAGKLLPDATIVALVQRWLESHDSRFVFDGFPRTIGQAEALEELLRERKAPLDAVVVLDADAAVLEERVLNRLVCSSCGHISNVGLQSSRRPMQCPNCGQTLVRRADDTRETFLRRMHEHQVKTAPVIEFYNTRGLIRLVDANQRIDAVSESVAQILST